MGRLNKKLSGANPKVAAPAQKTAPGPVAAGSKSSESLLLLKKPVAGHKVVKLKKKDKLKLKREGLEQKLQAAKSLDEEKKAKKKREKVPIVGDLKPMSDTLKMLNDILAQDDARQAILSRKAKKPQANKSRVKLKHKNAQFVRDIQVFGEVKKHPQFRQSPFDTIGTHLENKALADAAME